MSHEWIQQGAVILSPTMEGGGRDVIAIARTPGLAAEVMTAMRQAEEKVGPIIVATDMSHISHVTDATLGLTTMTLSTEHLRALNACWENGDGDTAVVAAVRDLFLGYDGHLRALSGVL